MNRYRMRFAPQVWTPNLKPSVVRWLQPLRLRKQRGSIRIAEVELSGGERVRQELEQGKGVMIMPNHSSHADPYVIYAAADAVQTPLHVMATWHVFHDQSWLTQRILRWHGCFSVDREANDIGAFRLATDILRNRPQPLVIFPEGEIYHCNDRVTPFREGAAAIAVAAARKADRPISCIPCAIKYRYVEDPTECLLKTMGELEESIYWRKRCHESLEQRIYRFAEVLLAIKELEYYQEVRSGCLPDRIKAFGDHLVSEVESRHGLEGDGQAIPERVKAARRVIIEKRSAEGVDEKTLVALDDDLEDLFLVVQSFSYPGDYVVGKPSIERIAETIDKFEEDVLRRPTATIKAMRSAQVGFGEPIEVSGDRRARGQTTSLTSRVEEAVQSMLDQFNSEPQTIA